MNEDYEDASYEENIHRVGIGSCAAGRWVNGEPPKEENDIYYLCICNGEIEPPVLSIVYYCDGVFWYCITGFNEYTDVPILEGTIICHAQINPRIINET